MSGSPLERDASQGYSSRSRESLPQQILANVEGNFVDSTVKLAEKVKLECIYPKKAAIIQTTWSTLEDIGLYFCSVVTYPDGIWEKVIEVIQPDAFEVSQKQNNHVFAKPGGNVTLTCPYKIGDSVQQVMWERLKADQADTVAVCNSSGKQSFGSGFRGRALMDCSDQASSMLVIQNITAPDFATYRCVATAGGNKTHVMSFTVTADRDHKWFIIYIAGGVSAAVLLFIFLLICITTAYCKKKKRKGITGAVSKTLQPAQTQPANSYGRPHFHGAGNTGRRAESSLGQPEIYSNCKTYLAET
ncbi:CD226 antigen [Porphyrio hochstetteri]